MICADTSSLIAFLEGEQARDTDLVAQALVHRLLALAPISVTELLSDPGLSSDVERLILGIPRLEISTGYWQRAGRLRASLHRHGLRPKIADTLVAQTCLDYEAPLVTRDHDFQGFARLTGLRLL